MKLDPTTTYLLPKTEHNFSVLTRRYNATVHGETGEERQEEINRLLEENWPYIVYNRDDDNDIYCCTKDDFSYLLDNYRAISLPGNLTTFKVRRVK